MSQPLKALGILAFGAIMLPGSALSGEVDPSLEMRRFPSQVEIHPDQLTEEICRGWVELQASEETQVLFWDLLVELEANTRLLVGCNEDFIYSLALSGQFRTGSQVVPAGKVCLWEHFGGTDSEPTVHPFSAPQLLRLFAAEGLAGDPDLKELASVRKALPNGEILSVSESVATSGILPDSFRTCPEVMAIKRISRHEIDYGMQTAQQFVKALSQQDSSLVSALLSPALFGEDPSIFGERPQARSERQAFAQRLFTVSDYETLDPSTLRDLGSFKYEVRSEARAYRVTLKPFRDGFYVARLDSIRSS